MKLHVGCGTVYLRDWINIDMPSPRTFLASERPDLVVKWTTTDDDYFAKHREINRETLRDGPLDQEMVCDQFGNFTSLCFRDGSINELLARHCFEHLSPTEARLALCGLREIMAPDGVVRIDVPDHEATIEALLMTKDRFYIRHLLGPRRNDFGFHIMSYTRDRLTALFEGHGFKFAGEEKNIHFYPAFCLRFTKQ
jgi:predicted SAM-dependent methyltransferase